MDKVIPSSVVAAIKSETNALDILDAGIYMCGHPQINDSVNIYLAVTENDLVLFQEPLFSGKSFDPRLPKQKLEMKRLGEIPKKAIKQISIEDKTTIQNRITATRLLTVGIFAFAWKKKEVNEMGFVVIEWTDSKNMENKTTFRLEGKGSLATANTLRNTLVNCL